MGTAPDKTEQRSKNMAILGIVSGVFALIMFTNPPMGLLFGAIAIILAWLSRSYTGTGRFSRMAIAALILGIIGVVLSVFIFFNYMLAIRIMDDPESIAASMDPASAQQFLDIINYYRALLTGGVQ